MKKRLITMLTGMALIAVHVPAEILCCGYHYRSGKGMTCQVYGLTAAGGCRLRLTAGSQADGMGCLLPCRI